MNAGSIVATLKLKIDGFKEGINQAQSQLDRFQNKTKNVSKDLKVVGGTMVAGGTAIATGLGGAVKTAASFEQQMSRVKAISGATDKDFAKLRDTAKHLGATTAFSAKEAGQGMEYLALAGWNTNEIIKGMPGMLNLAAAGGLDLARAADITSDTMQAFGMKADLAGHAADVFAYAQANANTNVEQLGEGMKYIAPIANQFGWSLEGTTAGMMALADSGLKGSIAGQAFASSLSRLSKPTKQMRDVMRETNMEFFDANGQLKPLPELIREIEKGTKGMTDQQKAATLSTLFGAEAYKHWAILLERGSDELAKMTTELENSDGTAAKMAETMLDNLNGAITILKSALEGLAISVGEVLLPYLTKFAQWLTKAVDWFNGLSDGTKKVIVVFAALSAAALTLGGGFLLFLSFIPNIVSGFNSFVKVMKLATTGVQLFGRALMFLFTNPIGLIILGIAALIAAIVLIVKHWDKVKEVTLAVWDAILNALSIAWEWIKAKLAEFGLWVADKWQAIWQPLKEFFVSVWEGIKSAGEAIWNGIKEVFFTVWNAMWDFIATILAVIYALIMTSWEGIKALAQAIWGVIGDYVIAVWEGIKSAAKTIWDAIKAYFTTVFNVYKTIFTTAWNAIKTVVTTVWNAIKSTAVSIFNALKSWFTTYWNAVKAVFTTVWNAIKSVLIPIWNAIKSSATSIFNALKSFFTTVLNAIKSVFTTVWNAIKSVLLPIWNGMKSSATSIFNSLKSTLASILNAIKSVFTSVFNAIKSMVTSIWNGIKSTTSSVWNGIKGVITSVINGIKSSVSSGANFMKSTFTGAINSVKSAFAGMWNAISGSLNKVVNGIKNKAAQAKEALSALNPFKRNSPSLVDNVKSGVNVIRKTYEGVADMRINPPTIGSVTAGLGVDVESAFGGGGNGNGGGTNYNAPLVQVENMNVRDDQDVRNISRELFNLQRSHDRSQGGR